MGENNVLWVSTDPGRSEGAALPVSSNWPWDVQVQVNEELDGIFSVRVVRESKRRVA